MRVLVTIKSSHAELLAELGPLPNSERAARLRTLATIGLMNLRSPGSSTVDASSDPSIGGGNGNVTRQNEDRIRALRKQIDD